MDARGVPGRPCLTAQHAGFAGDQGALTLYCFSWNHTHPPQASGAVVLSEKRVGFAGQTRRGDAWLGTKGGPLASTVLHGSGYILPFPTPPPLFFFFWLFFSLGSLPLWGGDGS